MTIKPWKMLLFLLLFLGQTVEAKSDTKEQSTLWKNGISIGTGGSLGGRTDKTLYYETSYAFLQTRLGAIFWEIEKKELSGIFPSMELEVDFLWFHKYVGLGTFVQFYLPNFDFKNAGVDIKLHLNKHNTLSMRYSGWDVMLNYGLSF